MEQIEITEFVNGPLKEYSKYVLYSRAIPSVIDGLKPSQRKIVWTATKVARSLHKTASLSGDVISKGNYHHGDMSLNDAINSLTQDFNNNVPLLIGKGSFGSRLVPEAAAARYTYVKLSNQFELYFKDNEILNSSDDPEDPEPRFYLPTIPWVLVNGIRGIAVGFATEIQPRNPKDLAKACKDYLTTGKISKRKLAPYYKSFTGEIKHNGEKWVCTGTYLRKTSTKLSVTELPVGTDRETYVKFLDKLEDAGKIVGYSDRCSKTGFNFEITLPRKSAHPSEERIISLLKLSKNLNDNFTLIDEDGNLKIFENEMEIMRQFCDYRLGKYQERINYQLNTLDEERKWLLEKMGFINSVIHGTIDFKGKTKKKLEDQLRANGHTYIERLMGLPTYVFTKDEFDKVNEKVTTNLLSIKQWRKADPKDLFLGDL